MSIEDRLREKIAASSAATDIARLEVELAIYLTRAGSFEEARFIYDKHHESQTFGGDVQLSLNVMLLDGLTKFYQDKSFDAALDRLNRALRLSLAANADSFTSRVSAWIAHLLFNSCKYAEMAERLKCAISRASARDADTLIRVALTLGDAFALCGDFKSAADWYGYARLHANLIEDRISVAALMHNRATMALSHCRFSEACGERPSVLATAYLLEVDSAANFETYIGMNNVLYPYEIWMGRIKMLDGNYREASEIFDSYIRLSENNGQNAMFPSVLSDFAYCQFKTGSIDKAIELMNQACSHDLSNLFKDDLAVLYKYSAAIVVGANIESSQHEFDILAEKARREYLDEASILKSKLAEVVSERAPVDDWPAPTS